MAEERNELRKCFREFIDKAQAKNFHQQFIDVICTCACSRQAHEVFENSVVSMRKAIEILDKYDTEEEIVTEFLDLLPLDDYEGEPEL